MSKSPATLTGSLPAAVAAVGKEQPLEDIATMQSRIDESLGSSRFQLTSSVPLLPYCCFMAAIGIYGMVAYNTTLRTAELGLRIDLNARLSAVIRTVIGRAMKLILAGGVLGLAAAFGNAPLGSAIDRIDPRDPVVYVVAFAVILVAALLAAVLPARRAAGLDPIDALRHE